MYNLACSYSRLNKLDEAYTYLAQAVDRGYNAFAYVEKDPDMENLRKHPDWKEKIQKWRQEYSYDGNTISGLIKEKEPRVSAFYYLCKSGIALLTLKDYCHNSRNVMLGYERGTWTLQNGDIKINTQEICKPDYVISKREKDIYDARMQGAAYYCPPGNPEFSGNCISKSGFSFHRPIIRRDIVKEIVKNSKQSSPEQKK